MTEFIRRAQQGDISAFREIYESYKDEAFRCCRGICEDRDDAEEVMQEAFIKIYRKLPHLKEPDKFRAWMYKILLNSAYTFINRRKTLPLDEFPEAVSGASEPSQNDNWQILLAALAQLPRTYRTVFILHFIQEIKHEDIAKILRISAITSRTNYLRAREKLKAIITSMGVSFDQG